MLVGTRSGIEPILELSGQVLQPVLPMRENYKHFRGLHLGAVCLNYLQGKPVLNPHASSSVHFTSSYEYAVGIAQSQAQLTLRHVLQFGADDARQLSELVGEDVTHTAFPSIVVALSPDQEAFLEPGDMEGEVFQGFLTPYDLDPYSQEALAPLLPRA